MGDRKKISDAQVDILLKDDQFNVVYRDLLRNVGVTKPAFKKAFMVEANIALDRIEAWEMAGGKPDRRAAVEATKRALGL